MSALGISEMRRWEQEVRVLFPWLPEVVITDDGVTVGHAAASVLPDGRMKIALSPEMVPGRALGWHEMGHVIQRAVQKRVDNMLALVRGAFAVRGFPPFADDQLYLTFEQMASMFPEAFIGEWGGYNHPLYGMDPAVVAPSVRTWFYSTASAFMRDWFLSLATWEGGVATDYPGAIWIASPNFNAGRPVTISATVEHWTVSTAGSAINEFKDAASKLSAHYLVTRDGVIYQFVREANRAWHDSSVGWNDKAIGIEHEGGPGQGWPDAQIAASAALHRDIWSRRGVLPAFGHGATYPVFTTECPGDLPIDLITEEDDMFTDADREKLTKVYDQLNAEGPRIWTQRLQDWLSKALKSVPTYAKSTDYSGPDVTTNLPRT